MSHEFDGAAGQISYGSAAVLDDLAVGGAFSVHVWYNADTVGEGSTGRIVQKRQNSSAGGWLFFSDATASLGFQAVTAAGAVTAEQRGANNACSLNVWHSVVLTYDDGGDRKGHIFVDGSEIGYDTDTAAAVANGTDAGGNLLLGNNIAGGRTFDGEQAEYATWNRVITAAEITSLSKGFSPIFFGNGLILYAPLVRNVVDWKGNPGSASGTVVTTHPSPIYRPAPLSLGRGAAPSYVADVFGDHPSEDPLRPDGASGIPTHTAPVNTFYIDEDTNILYRSLGAGSWVRIEGTHQRNIFVAAQAMTIISGTPPVRSVQIGRYGCLDMVNSGASEVVGLTVSIPDDWDGVSAFTLKVHWFHRHATETGAVRWNFVGQGITEGDTLNINDIDSTHDSATARAQDIFDVHTMSDTFTPASADEFLSLRLFRRGGDAEDTFEADVYVLGMEFEYTAAY